MQASSPALRVSIYCGAASPDLSAQNVSTCHAGALPASLANVESMVVLDASNNQLGGTLNDFAFQAAANRADLHSALRYFDIANNSFAGMRSDLSEPCPMTMQDCFGAKVTRTVYGHATLL